MFKEYKAILGVRRVTVSKYFRNFPNVSQTNLSSCPNNIAFTSMHFFFKIYHGNLKKKNPKINANYTVILKTHKGKESISQIDTRVQGLRKKLLKLQIKQ